MALRGRAGRQAAAGGAARDVAALPVGGGDAAHGGGRADSLINYVHSSTFSARPGSAPVDMKLTRCRGISLARQPGQILVKCWSSGQMLVKLVKGARVSPCVVKAPWPNDGPTVVRSMVKYWSNTGQILVKYWGGPVHSEILLLQLQQVGGLAARARRRVC
jgi:hypothetical protein